MAASSAAQSVTPRRKFQRMSAAMTTNLDMGAKYALGLLKNEAESIKRTGVSTMLSSGMQELAQPYLSGFGSQQYEDKMGEAHAEANEQLLNALPQTFKDRLCVSTSTVRHQMDATNALKTYVSLVDKLKEGPIDASDGVPEFYLDSAGGQAPGNKKKGGFQHIYQHINVLTAEQKESEQRRCIFAMKQTQFKAITGTYGTALIDTAAGLVQDLYDVDMVGAPEVVHVLFHWNKHSFYTYHQDNDGDVAVIINLGFGTSNGANNTMHVAGAELCAEYDGVGVARVFPTKLFHRSGSAPRRCVKVALFFKVDSAAKCEVKREANGEASASQTSD